MIEINLELIAIILSKLGITFSKTEAMKIVGGEARLIRLIERSEIRCDRANSRQNGRWQCDAGDVLRHIRI